jgi:hypothetical protein
VRVGSPFVVVVPCPDVRDLKRFVAVAFAALYLQAAGRVAGLMTSCT